jgi:hypothetical protein
LAEWKIAYKRGFAMQAALVFVGFLIGVLAWYLTSKGGVCDRSGSVDGELAMDDIRDDTRP